MPRALRLVLKTLALLGAVLAILLGAGALAVRAMVARAEAAYPAPGRFLTIPGGRRLHFSESGLEGSGTHTVVLLHGNSGTLRDFDPLVPLLAARTRVIAFDRPGHGYSDRPSVRETPAAQARAIRAALGELRVERPILVGHSWGGALALAYAMEFPAEVAGLVLVGTRAYPYDGPPDPLYTLLRTPVIGPVLRHSVVPLVARGPIERRVAAAFRPDSVDTAHLARARALWSRPSQVGATVWDTQLLQHAAVGMSRRYATLGHPVMLLVGDGDELRPETERLSRELRSAWIRVLPNTGHYAMRTRPADVVLAISELEARLTALGAQR